MPLTPGNDPKTIAQNIKKELEKGVPYKQAIAMSKSGKPKPKN